MDMSLANMPDVCGRLALAIILAGILGLERQRKGRGAGLRTHILVCLGSTLLMVIADLLAMQWQESGAPVWLDKGRMAAGIITGIGFLGAGTIITVGAEQRGLTTAAMIWFVAALGITIGAGSHLIAICATGFALLVVLGLGYIERFLPAHETLVLKIRLANGLERLDEIEHAIRDHGFDVETSRVRATGGGEMVDLVFELTAAAGTKIARLAPLLQQNLTSAEKITVER